MGIKWTALGFLVYAVMTVYLVVAAAYLARLRRLAEGLYAFGFVLAVAAFGLRWYEVNHVPLQNLFEVCLCLGMLMWPITLFCRRFLGVGGEAGDALIGFIILFPAGLKFSAEMQHLPPALQSPLFIPHVAAYMLAYVILAKAAVQALGPFLLRTRLAMAIFVIHRFGLLAILAETSLPQAADRLPPGWVPLAWMQALNMPNLAQCIAQLIWLLQWLAMPATAFLYEVNGGHWSAWVVLTALSDLVMYVPLVALLATGRALPLETRTEREQGAYRVSALGFPLLTLGLLLGAVWGKIAWGDYWNWDPKELWSLISWLVFLGYFHFRYMYGKRFPRINASLVLAGLVAIILTLLWVNLANLFKGGMHSYAS